MITPWMIHEAEVALYPAWKDGMPMQGPGLPRGEAAPLFACKSALSISASPRKTAAASHDWTAAPPNAEGDWEIALSFLDGAVADEVSRVSSRLAAGGLHILVIRFIDPRSGQWSRHRFYYVTWESDDSSESSQAMVRSMRLRSTWMQEEVGSATAPSLSPAPAGEVDWVCGPLRLTALSYDPVSEEWQSMACNDTGDGGRYVTLAPIAPGDGADVILAYRLPRLAPALAANGLPVSALLADDGAPVLTSGGDYILTDSSAGKLATLVVEWQHTLCLRVGNENSTSHHGLTLQGGHTLQAIGIVEPLLALPQQRVLDEPVLVFRYLRRVYATFGHGVLAVPRLSANLSPPASHDPAFRIFSAGAANPATGNAGLVLLPDGAWLDGTLLTLA